MMCVQLERVFAAMVDRELTVCISARALFDEMYKMTIVVMASGNWIFVARKLPAASLRFLWNFCSSKKHPTRLFLTSSDRYFLLPLYFIGWRARDAIKYFTQDRTSHSNLFSNDARSTSCSFRIRGIKRISLKLVNLTRKGNRCSKKYLYVCNDNEKSSII